MLISILVEHVAGFKQKKKKKRLKILQVFTHRRNRLMGAPAECRTMDLGEIIKGLA